MGLILENRLSDYKLQTFFQLSATYLVSESLKRFKYDI